MKRLTFLFAAFLAVIAAPLTAQEFPALTGRVVDNADIIPADAEAALTAKLEALEAQTQRQLVVVTVPDLQGYDEQTFTYQLGREWGIGDAERNDGAILLVAMKEKKVRIESGYGLEGYLTDALSALIIQNQIVPRFREGDFAGGITDGADGIIEVLRLSPEEAAQITSQAQQTRKNDGGFPFGALIWLGFLLLFFIIPAIRGGRRYRSKGTGPWGDRGGASSGGRGQTAGNIASNIILWEIGSAIARGAMGGGGGGFGGGGGGGGGFSGGGGSFGGGGASGGW